MLVTDGLTNLASSLGTDKDKAAATRWIAGYRSPEEYEQLYRASAFARKIVDIPTGDMLRRWRGWSADDKFVTSMEAQEKRRRVRKVVAEAHRFARLFGSSAIIVNTKSGLTSDPLITDAMPVGDLVSFRVDIYPRLQIEAWNTDTASVGFGEPLTYLYQPVVRGFLGGQVRIHASRVIPFAGVPLTPLACIRSTAWGDSVFTSLEQTLNTAGTTTAVIASLLHEAKKDIISTDLSEIGTADGEARVKQRFALANYLKSVNNMLLLGSDEKYQQMTLNFSGLPDIHVRMLQELSGAADIPATRLLGQAPAGMSSTGESDLRNYYDSLSSKQEDELREGIERLDAIIEADIGLRRDPAAFWYFHPLWQETTTQKAENAYKRAQAVKLIADTALVPDEVLQPAFISHLIESGDYPSLEAEWKTYQAEPGGDDADADDDPVEEVTAATPRLRPLLRVVGDAAPRTLYIHRKVENAGEILAWAKSQGFTNTLAADDLHVTVCYSRTPVDWFKVGAEYEEKIVVPRGGPRQMAKFGEATVLLFSSWSLQWRHESIREAGASWDHPEFQPHVTISVNASDVDLSKVEPYQGKILLGVEVFEEIEAPARATA